ncbi:riboflavin synthase [Paenibacillus aurantius]|uniref:Riboflavin synthase n=1 Tax=Paenibacillus aurantius TaxID=2918900 RepID=A0AA96L979_9BACL|nr:riboflavin synthase [Paenibacillus aurantius]WNQ09337.1 riboflavin synthase [Paenibacillus aurantius]
MFTGIIEEIGTMSRIARQGQAMILTIAASKILEDVHLGDSISVNGVCLTVVAFDRSSVTMDVMPETYRHTNLKGLKPGDRVNLERAMAANGRYGGHMVQGHVDSPGTITGRQPEENAVVFTVEPDDAGALKYIVPRGSITLDGISLTVIRVTDATFSVSIIPHTLAQTILADKQPGDMVNVECDMMGKYLERLLTFREAGEPVRKTGRLTESFLAEHGFR